MTTSTIVKNHQINLPDSIGKKLENKKITLTDNGLVIILKIEPVQSNTSAIRNSLTNVTRILKNKNIDSLKYQKHIRSSWNSRLTKLNKQYVTGH